MPAAAMARQFRPPARNIAKKVIFSAKQTAAADLLWQFIGGNFPVAGGHFWRQRRR
ncbi:MAG: hypothetical protein HAW59_03745 [Betaproteobacteria bacterium]|nr:hypothetical protein [Betaproteobacteria bacterium]